MGVRGLTPEADRRRKRDQRFFKGLVGLAGAGLSAVSAVGNTDAAFFDPTFPAPRLAAVGMVVAGLFGLGSTLVLWDAIRGKE